MVQVQKGAVKFKSIREAAKAAGIPYITFYMRLRMQQNASKAFHQKVRPYNRQQNVVAA